MLTKAEREVLIANRTAELTDKWDKYRALKPKVEAAGDMRAEALLANAHHDLIGCEAMIIGLKQIHDMLCQNGK